MPIAATSTASTLRAPAGQPARGQSEDAAPMMQFTMSAGEAPAARSRDELPVWRWGGFGPACLYHMQTLGAAFSLTMPGSKTACINAIHESERLGSDGRERRSVFVAGGTGYGGNGLISRLLERSHEVRARCDRGRRRSCQPVHAWVFGNALDGPVRRADRASGHVRTVSGVAHPSPAKGAEFRRVDLPSGLGAVAAAKSAEFQHFVYLSVAHPHP